MHPNPKNQDQKIGYARASLWAPFYTVGLSTRIRGEIPIDLLQAALRKLQILYPPLASRVRLDDNGAAWLTTEGVGEFPLEIRSRSSDDDWAELFLEQERIPFRFDRGPVTRFFLLRGEKVSDLVVVLPHVVCDGVSMACVMSDAVALLNDPDRVVTRPLPFPVVSWQTVNHSIFNNLLLRGGARVLNRIWPDNRLVLNQDRYEDLHRQYWAHQHSGLLSFGLTSSETSNLVNLCRQHGVSVTGALVSAFLKAQAEIQPSAQKKGCEISVAINLRDRLLHLPEHSLGVYASAVYLKMCSKPGKSFWELAQEGTTQIHKLVKNHSLILRPLVLDELNPSIADALIEAVSTDQWTPELNLLTRFVKIKGESRCLNISNIGRIELPEMGNPYQIETVLPFPPLEPGGRIMLNVLTINGHMNIILKYRHHEVDSATATQIKDRALSYLLAA